MTDTVADWLPVDAAARAIGCSKRTIERLAARHAIGKALRPQVGSPAVAVYDPQDVAAIAAARQRRPAPVILGAVSDPPHGHGTGRTDTPGRVLQTVPAGEDLIRGLALLLSKALQSPPSPPVTETVAETLYVTVKDAAAILGLPQVDVRVLVLEGDLPHRVTQRGGIRIRRKDLEAL